MHRWMVKTYLDFQSTDSAIPQSNPLNKMYCYVIYVKAICLLIDKIAECMITLFFRHREMIRRYVCCTD